MQTPTRSTRLLAVQGLVALARSIHAYIQAYANAASFSSRTHRSVLLSSPPSEMSVSLATCATAKLQFSALRVKAIIVCVKTSGTGHPCAHILADPRWSVVSLRGFQSSQQIHPAAREKRREDLGSLDCILACASRSFPGRVRLHAVCR
jgi:hypothetical protein